MTISPSLNEQFEALTNLAVITNVIPYFFCMAAMEFIMIKAGHGRREELRLPMIASFMGSLYTLYACYAAGADAMMAAALVYTVWFPCSVVREVRGRDTCVTKVIT